MGPYDALQLGPEQTKAAVYANTFTSLEPAAGSIAMQTYALRHSALRELSERTAEEFLVNSRLRRRDAEFEVSIGSYFAEPGRAIGALVGQYERPGWSVVALPDSIPVQMALGETIRRRRSVRSYTGEAIPLSYLATLMRAGCGVTGSAGEELGIPLRSAPSGGALYPIDLHVVALRVDGLARGVFLYDARRDVLWQTGAEATLDFVLGAVATPDEVISTTTAGAILLLVGRPWRVMRKYGARGMRHMFLEAGAIAEHMNLAAVALGLGSVDCSGIYDDEVHEAMGLDGLYETLVHTVVVGIAA